MEYKDKFTFDGRLKPVNGVSAVKVEAANALLTRAMRGDKIADGTLQEAFSTSDLQFNLAYLVSQEVLPQFDEAERTWSQLAGTRTVPTFDNVRLFSLFNNGLTGAGIREGGGAVRIPEGAPYPHVTVTGQEALYKKIGKNGLRFAWTWESNINDLAGFFAGLPAEILQVALDTEQAEVMDALLEGVDKEARALEGGTLPDESVVLPNSPLTPNALREAIREVAARTVNGRTIGRITGWNVLVAPGKADFIEFQLSQSIIQIVDGNIVYSAGDRDSLSNITVIEDDRIEGDEWYMLPKPGSYRRPVLELARLRGHETPELRVQNATGQYFGGGAVSPFEGSFDNDTIDMRLRYVAGGLLWTDDPIVYSDGSGVA